MKNIHKFLSFNKIYLILAFGFLGVSCQDILDPAPDGKLSYEEVFSDQEKVGAYLNTCYSNLPAKGFRYYQWTNFFDAVCDNGWDGEKVMDLPVPLMYHKEASASNHPFYDYFSTAVDDKGPNNSRFWEVYWTAIRQCAIFIKYIDNANVVESTKARWKAEAHVLRAYYYLELIRLYGGNLPIEDDPYGVDMDFSSLEQRSFYDITKFIIEDCDKALAIPELPWRITTSAEETRVTKALAEAIKSRAILYAASPLFANGENHWKEAYEITKAAAENLKTNGYKLYDQLVYPDEYIDAFDNNTSAAIFNEYHTKKMLYQADEPDQETIWQNHSKYANVEVYIFHGIPFQTAGTRPGICPSQELADAFETTDGKPVLNLENPYLDEQHLQPNYNTASIYKPEEPYKNRDPRMAATMYYHLSHRKCYWQVKEGDIDAGVRDRLITTNIEDPYTGRNHDNQKSGTTLTGYYHRKTVHPLGGRDTPAEMRNAPPFKIFRYAEVLLNYAEAAAEYGRLDDALSAVNEVRARVNMPALTNSLTQKELILRIKNERRVELAYEEHRYFDVRRWSDPNGDLSKTDKWVTGINIEIDGTKPTGYSYTRSLITNNSREYWRNKNLLLPIPVDENNRLEELTGKKWQRPNW